MSQHDDAVTSHPQARAGTLAPARSFAAAPALLVIGIAAIGLRALLYRSLPAIVAADSWDFLRAARDLYERADFYSGGLRDVRLPGYPVFLAATLPLTQLRSDAIVVLQSGVGVATVAAGWWIGELLGSRRTAVVLAAFLLVNPVYLLNEHAVMSETLALALDTTLVAVWLLAMRRASTSSYLLLGAVLGVAVLTRANCLALGTVLVAGLCLHRGPADRPALRRVAARVRPAILVAIAMSAVLAPWVRRNDVAYGRPSIYLFGARNTLVYMAMHVPLDETLPTLAHVNGVIGAHAVDYAWLWELRRRFPPPEDETLAGRIIREELAAHPRAYLHQMARTALAFVGVDDSYGNERSSMLLWFRQLVTDVAQLHRLGTSGPPPSAGLGFAYVPSGGDDLVTRGLSRFGAAYLRPGRAIGLLAALTLMAWYARRVRDPRGFVDPRFHIVSTLAAGYVATVAMHAAMFTDTDRYSTAWDFVPVLVVCLILAERANTRTRVR